MQAVNASATIVCMMFDENIEKKRSMCGCTTCSCKKNSKPKTTVNNAHLSVANIQGA